MKPNFDVTGYTKPNCKVTTLLNPVPEYVSNLTDKDILIFFGGSNDVSNNNMEVTLQDIQQFVTKNNYTNIILGEIPNRYDTAESSDLHQKIMTYNRKLKKHSKLNTHIHITETVQERKYYTNQGFHLNALGIDALCSQLRIIVDKIFMNNDVPPIPMEWKKEHLEQTENTTSTNIDNVKKSKTIIGVRTSNRK